MQRLGQQFDCAKNSVQLKWIYLYDDLISILTSTINKSNQSNWCISKRLPQQWHQNEMLLLHILFFYSCNALFFLLQARSLRVLMENSLVVTANCCFIKKINIYIHKQRLKMISTILALCNNPVLSRIRLNFIIVAKNFAAVGLLGDAVGVSSIIWMHRTFVIRWRTWSMSFQYSDKSPAAGSLHWEFFIVFGKYFKENIIKIFTKNIYLFIL